MESCCGPGPVPGSFICSDLTMHTEMLRGVVGRRGDCVLRVPIADSARQVFCGYVGPSLGTYATPVASGVHGSPGCIHVTLEPSVWRLSGTFAVIHFTRRV